MRFKHSALVVAALAGCLSFASICRADWPFAKVSRSIENVVAKPMKNLVTGNFKKALSGKGATRATDVDDAKNGKEHFEAMCILTRDSYLSAPPEVRFFSTKSHSSSTLGCSEGHATFKLDPSTLAESSSGEENLDNDLRQQLIQGNLYDGSLATYFIIHGFLASWESPWMCQLKDSLLNGSEANVFIVDWSGGSMPLMPIDYGGAVANTKIVAERLANFIRALQRVSSVEDASRFHLIGHSLGGQISGFVGYSLGGQLGRITALDPAGPCFSQWRSTRNATSRDGFLDVESGRRRLSASSAKLVMAIHTNCNLFGLNENCAHYDIYVNGGVQQPGCAIRNARQMISEISNVNLIRKLLTDLICAHSYAHDLGFTFGHQAGNEMTHETRCYPVAYECSSWEAFNAGECGFCLDDDAACIFVGLNRDIEKSFPPTRLTYPSDETPTSEGWLTDNRGIEDCKFNGELNCNGDRLSKALFPTQRFTVSSNSSPQTDYLISSARHYLKSGPIGSTQCLYHYQVLIAVKRENGEPGGKYYLRIPLQPGHLDSYDSADAKSKKRNRLVQVSHAIDRNSTSYANIEKNYLPQFEGIAKNKPSDYLSALITFAHSDDFDTLDSKTISQPLESLKEAELWSKDAKPIKGVQWVAINFMSSLDQGTRAKYSHVFQVNSDIIQTGSDPKVEGRSKQGRFSQMLAEIKDMRSSIDSVLLDGLDPRFINGEPLNFYIKLRSL